MPTGLASRPPVQKEGHNTVIDYKRISLCQGMSPDSTFEEDVQFVSALGVGGTSLLDAKLEPGREAAQLSAFRASGLRATGCLNYQGSPLPTYPRELHAGPEDPDRRIELMCDSIRKLAPYEPEGVVLVTGSSQGYAPADARRIAVEGLREAAKLCAALGFHAMIEPIRFPGYDASFVRNLPDTLDLIDEIGFENVSVVYDTYHLWDTPDIVSLSKTHADRIGVVQVSDWREPPRCIADRLLPGEGSAGLPILIAALEEGGYAGYYDVEVFSDDGRWGTPLPDSLWLSSPTEIYSRALAALERTWERAEKQ